MAISSIAGVSNVDLWNLARKEDPTFASHTSKGTADLFTDRGFEAIQRSGIGVINEWFGISMRIAFQLLNAAGAKNPLADSGLVEVFDTPNGGYVQRMAVSAIKPVTPAYRGLENGQSVDPFIVRKPEIAERFFAQNFDFQNLITNQSFQTKTIFVSEYGMGQVLAGILEALSAAYTKQEYYNVLECLNAALNSTSTPMQDSQVVRLTSWTDAAPTAAEITEFIKIAKNVARDMESTASTSKYNAAGFDTVERPEDHIMLVRPSVLTDIETLNALNAPGNASIPFEVRAVEHFGGMNPVVEISGTPTNLVPMYDKLGAATEYFARVGGDAEGATFDHIVNESGTIYVHYIKPNGTASYVVLNDSEDSYDVVTMGYTNTGVEVKYVDPNEGVLAVIAQRGVIFENAQNPYTVEPIRNPRGMYDNYFANRPGTAIVYDAYRDLIAICKPLS